MEFNYHKSQMDLSSVDNKILSWLHYDKKGESEMGVSSQIRKLRFPGS